MSRKYSSLAFDEVLKEFDSVHLADAGFEPELKVLVNVHYSKAPGVSAALPKSDVVQVSGRITVSF